MKEWEAIFHQPKSVEKLLENALIVIDSNVLISAYQWREVTVKEMLKALEKLNDQNRLKIPKQVIVEFAKNRPNQIIQRINDIEGAISSLKEDKSLNQKAHILEGKGIYERAGELQQKYNDSVKEYRQSLTKLRDELKKLFKNDPYLNSINNILEKAFYSPFDSEQEKELIKEAEERFKNKIPPGFQDSSKGENKAGDYIIWKSILQLNNDIIFVSGDVKNDWVYTDKHENLLSARRELIEEFYKETNGKDFVHISPKEFIKLLNPTVSEEVQNDLTLKPQKPLPIFLNKPIIKRNSDFYILLISETLTKFDPMNIILDLEHKSDEYISEARMIYDSLLECGSLSEVRNLVTDVFKSQFEGVAMGISEKKLKNLVIEIADIRMNAVMEQLK